MEGSWVEMFSSDDPRYGGDWRDQPGHAPITPKAAP